MHNKCLRRTNILAVCFLSYKIIKLNFNIQKIPLSFDHYEIDSTCVGMFRFQQSPKIGVFR